ncbi:polymer-forming cytoskeletal protein [Candidatus Wolfebacteria bacterium]|nr:polymer-forming cytoskeletal protein [Candidatus Wolfebacteria bacterium]
MKKLLLISILFIFPLISFAAIKTEKYQEGAFFETKNNFYIAGNMINISEDKLKDVFAVGNMISVTGNIGEDLSIAGSNVNITSKIEGDLRVGGANININAPVKGDLMVFGGQIELSPSTVISGDLVAMGGLLNFSGLVNENFKICGDEVRILGTLNKDGEIRAKRLIIGAKAVINGKINYYGNEEAVISEGAKINNEIIFTKTEKPIKKEGFPFIFAGIFGIVKIFKFLTVLAASLLLFFLMKKSVIKIAEKTANSFWKNLLRGFITAVIIPVAIIILFITIIGLLIGLFGAIFYAILILLAKIFAVILVAQLLNLFFQRKNKKPLNWIMVVLGAVILELIVLIPIIGWIASLIIFLAAFGAISETIYLQFKAITE